MIQTYSHAARWSSCGSPTSRSTYAGKLEGIGAASSPLPDRILLYAEDGDAAVSEVHRRGLKPSSVLVRRSSLEDVFLQLTGRTLVD